MNNLSIKQWTVDELLEVQILCHVCTGHSPSWDGHTTNPVCRGAALNEIERRARQYKVDKREGVWITVRIEHYDNTGRNILKVGNHRKLVYERNGHLYIKTYRGEERLTVDTPAYIRYHGNELIQGGNYPHLTELPAY